MSLSATKHKDRHSVLMPVTTMEEVWLPDDAERAKLVASLKESESAIRRGLGSAHDPDTFVAAMLAIREAAKSKA